MYHDQSLMQESIFHTKDCPVRVLSLWAGRAFALSDSSRLGAVGFVVYGNSSRVVAKGPGMLYQMLLSGPADVVAFGSCRFGLSRADVVEEGCTG